MKLSLKIAKLYVCATPIGNLGDISERLKETLSEASVIACEDTRVTQSLLSHLNLSKPTFSLHAHNEKGRTEKVIAHLSRGEDVALVSDAGTPTVSDPGAIVCTAVREAGYEVVPVSGPSAVSTFLSVSGFSADRYYFQGFLPRKPSEIAQLKPVWDSLACPIVFFDSAQRLVASIERLTAVFEIDHLVLGKELTKRYETILAGSVPEVLAQLESIPVKGEWVGALKLKSIEAGDGPDVKHLVSVFKAAGISQKQAVFIGKDLGVSRNSLYEEWLRDS